MGRIESLFGSNFNLIVNMIPLCYFLLVVLHALENALRRKRRLKKHDYRDIKKLPEVIFYSVASALIGVVFYKHYGTNISFMVALSIVTRMLFFDPAFNIFCQRWIGYENPKKGNSLWDKIEQVLPFWEREVIYLGLYIALLVW